MSKDSTDTVNHLVDQAQASGAALNIEAKHHHNQAKDLKHERKQEAKDLKDAAKHNAQALKDQAKANAEKLKH